MALLPRSGRQSPSPNALTPPDVLATAGPDPHKASRLASLRVPLGVETTALTAGRRKTSAALIQRNRMKVLTCYGSAASPRNVVSGCARFGSSR